MSSDDGALRLKPSGSEAKAICVFVHGRGQSPEEMQSHVMARLSAPSVAFVLPRAPRGAWWDARAVDPLTTVARAQLSDALDHLAAVVAAARAAAPRQPMLLAGFSQGSCARPPCLFVVEAQGGDGCQGDPLSAIGRDARRRREQPFVRGLVVRLASVQVVADRSNLGATRGGFHGQDRSPVDPADRLLSFAV